MPGIKDNFLDLIIGHITGFVTRQAYVRGSGNPLKKILGIGLQLGVTNFVSKHPDGIKSAILKGVQGVIQRFKSRNSTKNGGNKLYYDIE